MNQETHTNKSRHIAYTTSQSIMGAAAADGEPADPRQAPIRSGGCPSGAPPSNTAPANYISENKGILQVLRFGVDSLYLSYPGTLATGWDQRLKGLKLAAKANDRKDESTAQVKIGDHLFEVKDRGQGRFPYVLEDNWFRIALSSSAATAMPLAYVQVSSELLTAIGVKQAEEDLSFVINTLGLVKDEANISRVDLFVDFITDTVINSWDSGAWVTRAHNINAHHVQRQFSGWSIGLGKGPIGARLYDKTLEIQKSHKDYLKPLWRDAGWQDDQKIWRLEFEFKRDVLSELAFVKSANSCPARMDFGATPAKPGCG